MATIAGASSRSSARRSSQVGGVMFCENAIHLAAGTLRVGDTVQVLEHRA